MLSSNAHYQEHLRVGRLFKNSISQKESVRYSKLLTDFSLVFILWQTRAGEIEGIFIY